MAVSHTKKELFEEVFGVMVVGSINFRVRLSSTTAATIINTNTTKTTNKINSTCIPK